MTNATTVEREVDHQFTRRRAAKRSDRSMHEYGSEDRHFDTIVSHAGERSPQNGAQARCVGAEGFEPSLGTV